MFKALRHMKGEDWGVFGISVIFIAAQVWLDLKIPDFMTQITTMVKTEGSDMSRIWTYGALMLLCAVGGSLCAVATGFLASRLAANFSRRLRGEIFDRVQAFSMEEMDRFSTASLITRSTNDVTQIQNFVSRGLQGIVRAPILAAWALAKISLRHWEWTAVTGGGVLIVVMTVVFMVLYAQPRFRRVQTLTDDLNKVTRENLTGIRVVRAYNAEAYQEAKFEEANSRLTTNNLQARRAMGAMRPVTKLVNNVLTIAIYGIGAGIIAAAPDNGLVQAFMSLNFIFGMLPRATISANRINEVLDCEPAIRDGEETEGLPGAEGTVEFRNVTFRYPGAEKPILHDITFTAEKGQTVAFIGATGSGKTTLVNLIPRFYDVTEGEVLVDGRDVREYTQTALRKRLGYAPQRAVLFTGTVASNVSYGDSGRPAPTAEEVRQAVDIAQASDFVEKMEGGYDAYIARGGGNVSGGQKQRLSIARAVARKPEIYIFDDTFSALDYRTDKALRRALQKETQGITTILVAQRIGTILEADRIFVLEEGRIVGAGTHRELMETCPVYREIAASQLSEEVSA